MRSKKWCICKGKKIRFETTDLKVWLLQAVQLLTLTDKFAIAISQITGIHTLISHQFKIYKLV